MEYYRERQKLNFTETYGIDKDRDRERENEKEIAIFLKMLVTAGLYLNRFCARSNCLAFNATHMFIVNSVVLH